MTAALPQVLLAHHLKALKLPTFRKRSAVPMLRGLRANG